MIKHAGWLACLARGTAADCHCGVADTGESVLLLAQFKHMNILLLDFASVLTAAANCWLPPC